MREPIPGDGAAAPSDAQIDTTDAGRMVAQIVATGRRLEPVFITHAHPDHNPCLEAILTAFPGADACAGALRAAILAGNRDPGLGFAPDRAIAAALAG